MKLPANLVEGFFVKRLNRFAALALVNGQESLIHVANSGRMGELFVPGYRLLLRPATGQLRKTCYDLALVEAEGVLVSADARLPSALVQEAFEQGRLPQFRQYSALRREVVFGESRLDMLLERAAGPRCYVETKSATLVVGGVALFPDAPTTRGVKHLRSLAQAVAAGSQAAAIFVVQRADALRFAPHDAADPELGRALREAVAAGVAAYAYACRVTADCITLADQIPIRL